MMMIYFWDKPNGGYLDQALLKYILRTRDIKSMFFF